MVAESKGDGVAVITVLGASRIRAAATGIGAVALVCAAIVMASPPSPAGAAMIVDAGAPGLLRLEVAPGPLDTTLTPGDRAWWSVTTRLDAPDSSPLDMAVEHGGMLAQHPAGLRIEVLECAEPWLTPADPLGTAICSSGATVIITDRQLASIAPTDRMALGDLAAGGARFLLLLVGLSTTAPSELQGQVADLAVGFFVAGDGERSGGPLATLSPLAGTGAVPLIVVPLALAAILLVVGSALRVTRREPTGGHRA